jgi:adenylate cyclase
LLTSKEIIEKTGLSRATLNNYIASGLVARPQVLPPGPEHGAAPRIGYFPDDTLTRIETIQRLKREGWSIARIAEHFAAGSSASPAAPAARPSLPATATATASGTATAPPSPAPAARDRIVAGLALSPSDASQPAWLVDAGFGLVWMNPAAGTSPLSPVAGRVAEDSVFRHLLALEEARGRDALLRFHLEAARSRGVPATQLFAGLAPEAAASLQARYGEVPRPAALPLVAQSLLPGTGAAPACWIHAVHFHQGVLFALSDAGEAAAAPAAAGAASGAPTLSPVAVLVALLQDAAQLWVRLSAEEYFELLNELGGELDAIFRAHGGRPGRPAGEALVCCFLPQAGGSYLWNALAAAERAREAVRQASQRWRARKGWDLELRLAIGIDEGHDWLGTLGPPGQAELRVLGDAADRATQLARSGRRGAILVTRNLVGKLSRQERQQLTYGVPRPEGTPGEAPLLSSFARLADLAGPAAAPAAFADLAVAELLGLQASHPPAGHSR